MQWFTAMQYGICDLIFNYISVEEGNPSAYVARHFREIGIFRQSK
jgi:hypothetical protein